MWKNVFFTFQQKYSHAPGACRRRLENSKMYFVRKRICQKMRFDVSPQTVWKIERIAHISFWLQVSVLLSAFQDTMQSGEARNKTQNPFRVHFVLFVLIEETLSQHMKDAIWEKSPLNVTNVKRHLNRNKSLIFAIGLTLEKNRTPASFAQRGFHRELTWGHIRNQNILT